MARSCTWSSRHPSQESLEPDNIKRQWAANIILASSNPPTPPLARQSCSGRRPVNIPHWLCYADSLTLSDVTGRDDKYLSREICSLLRVTAPINLELQPRSENNVTREEKERCESWLKLVLWNYCRDRQRACNAVSRGHVTHLMTINGWVSSALIRRGWKIGH